MQPFPYRVLPPSEVPGRFAPHSLPHLQDPEAERATLGKTWQAMEAILESGKARSVGMSNQGVHHL